MSLFGNSKKEDSFITQLRTQAGKTCDCLAFLQQNMNDITDETVKQNKEMIDELIEIKIVLVDDLHNTFITPIDREDIYNISNAMFDMAKYSLTTLEEMYLLKVKPDIFISDMVEKVKAEAHELQLAIERIMKNPRIASEHVVNVTKLEGKIDKKYREAVKDLFGDNTMLEKDLKTILYTREVYRHISNMSDRAQAAANVLGMAVIKLS
ncbi:MAG: DUF47 family protein [Sphingobacteriales bacterium]|nr:DUF47 family protein [Sphingobacteriales bacterium]